MKVRCAVYTRKSSEEGLEQNFNSLHAQREACEAYILSQASEGWTLLPDEYDDGGLSGGSLERPALKRLLADIAAGKIDIVVVYKVDRLTRSLLDFSTLVRAFDAAGTSFVSVTQSFNTTTSMGRLTLNMLLSFAQFEREVTAERIRDKIAASKAKGMWMGGTPPIGYKPAGRTLQIVEEHAETIRHIFQRYLELGTVKDLARDLEKRGVRTPQRRTLGGRDTGGTLFFRGQLHDILKNAVYIGLIPHRKARHPGLHPAIIDHDLWERVQQQLAAHVKGPRVPASAKHRSLLAGLVFDENRQPLVATHSAKGSRRYRYYVTRALQHNLADVKPEGIRVPAREIEAAVIDRLADALADPIRLLCAASGTMHTADFKALQRRAASVAHDIRKPDHDLIRELVGSVQVLPEMMTCALKCGAVAKVLGTELPADSSDIVLSVPLRLTRTGKVVRLIQTDGRPSSATPVDQSLVRMIARARGWWARLRTGEIHVAALAREEGVTRTYLGKFVQLAFLSPDIVEAILAGNQPARMSALALTARRLPLSWNEQQQLLR
jgi:DNA invertase Pin-like site-specific DNA recombinase